MGDCWIEWVCDEDNKCAVIECIKPFSSVSVGGQYQCWGERSQKGNNKHYRLWNDLDHCVWLPQSVFKIIDKGTVL